MPTSRDQRDKDQARSADVSETAPTEAVPARRRLRDTWAGSVVVALLVACALAAANAALTYALVPHNTRSEVTWNDYREMSSMDVDIVYFGTSTSMRAFIPRRIDTALGTLGYNLSTPNQRLDETYAGVRQAIEDHDLATIVLGLDLETLADGSAGNPGRAYVYFKDVDDAGAYAADALQMLVRSDVASTSDSINWVFPWLYNRVGLSKETIQHNIETKREANEAAVYEETDDAAADADEVDAATDADDDDAAAAEDDAANEPGGWRGLVVSTKVYDYARDKQELLVERFDEGSQPSEGRLNVLRQIAELCEENGVRLVVVTLPWPDYQVVAMGDMYYDYTEAAAQVVREAGGEFYDLNLAKPELLDAGNDCFKDFQHLNKLGGQLTSNALIRLLQGAGEGDAAGLFYTREEWEASLAGVDFVDVGVKCNYAEGTIQLEVEGFTDPDAELEYRILVQDPATTTDPRDAQGDKGSVSRDPVDIDTTTWIEVRDWSTSTILTYVADDGREGKRAYRFLVLARRVGSDDEWQARRVAIGRLY